MQTQNIRTRRSRTRDFPEHQVGYPERNDASNPGHESERIHVDLDAAVRLSKKTAVEITREMRGMKNAHS